MIKRFTKVIVHPGMYHADELVALVLLRAYGISWEQYKRTRKISDEDRANPYVLIIDVGDVLDILKSNVDHHQDKRLPAACVLIADWLSSEGLMSRGVRLRFNAFLTEISDIDRGITKTKPATGLCEIVESLNRTMEFNDALNFVQEIVNAHKVRAEKYVKDYNLWKKFTRIGHRKIVIGDRFIADWLQMAREDGTLLFITPNNGNGGATMLSPDAVVDIPSHEGQTYRHSMGYMAKYNKIAVAEMHALDILK